VPAQTRGFLFSDLRGYSAYTERHGDRAARELLTRYRRIVREAIASFGGAEIRTEGDSFYIVFDSVSAAVQAGLAIQTALAGSTDGGPIQAGIGIHAGEVEDDAEQGIVSSAVNIAARICAAAEPGEVLVSDTVRSLTRGYLDAVFLSAGRRRLKGIADPITLYRAQTTDQSAEAPLRFSPRRRSLTLAAAVGTLLIASLLVATMIREGVGLLADVPGTDAPESPAPGLPSATAPRSAGTSGVTTIDRSETGAYVPPIPLAAGRYSFADFQPKVTFAADGPGWYAPMDQVDAALLLLDDPSPSPGLTEVASIAFGSVQLVFSDPCNLADSTVLDATPSALIEWLQSHESLTTSSARPVNIGGYSGLEIEVSLADGGCRGATRLDLFPVAQDRYYVDAEHRYQVTTVAVGVRPLTILVRLTPTANDEVAAEVMRLVDSIEIDP
jgi:class 3 adenylate cyclase